MCFKTSYSQYFLSEFFVNSYWHVYLLCKTEGAPNYYPNSFSGPIDGNLAGGATKKHACLHTDSCAGDVKKFNSADEDNFTQVGGGGHKSTFLAA